MSFIIVHKRLTHTSGERDFVRGDENRAKARLLFSIYAIYHHICIILREPSHFRPFELNFPSIDFSSWSTSSDALAFTGSSHLYDFAGVPTTSMDDSSLIIELKKAAADRELHLSSSDDYRTTSVPVKRFLYRQLRRLKFISETKQRESEGQRQGLIHMHPEPKCYFAFDDQFWKTNAHSRELWSIRMITFNPRNTVFNIKIVMPQTEARA